MLTSNIGKSKMSIEIRTVNSQAEYYGLERLQLEIWGAPEIEVIPADLFMIIQKNGGVALGAFDRAAGDRLVGFVFGFVGLLPDGSLKHCSHVAGVRAEYRDRNIGYLLKLAQRDTVLKQGIELITWTFDPLESRNARFNFHKLGAVCNNYFRNLYGEMRDTLNAGLPSDRFQVDWRIAEPRVAARLRGEQRNNPRKNEVPLINPPVAGEILRPGEQIQAFTGDAALIQIPSDFQRIKSNDRGLALAWREQTRRLFEQAFCQGYFVTDLLVDERQSFYLLQSGDALKL
jgi:predicted GNAT superfamily acetyltransferase